MIKHTSGGNSPHQPRKAGPEAPTARTPGPKKVKKYSHPRGNLLAMTPARWYKPDRRRHLQGSARAVREANGAFDVATIPRGAEG